MQDSGQPNVDGSERLRLAYLLPVYNEAAGIAAFHSALSATTSSLAGEFDVQFLYINDGSRDSSLDELLALRASDERVAILGLSRNYGHQIAITAGLDHADADAAIIMDTDLQDPPHVSLEMIEKWRAGADVVYAQRKTRDDSAFKKVSASIFYSLLARIAAIDIPRDTGDFRLLDRRVVDELRRCREHNRFMRGLVSYVGFRQEAVTFDRDARFAGTTNYPLRKMIRLAGDGILGFSTFPLRMISRMGYLVSALSFAGIIYVIAVRLIQPEQSVPGWAFLALAVFLLSGVQIMMLGILGSYLGRVYVEVQNRPLYAVAVMAGGRSSDATES